MNKTLAWSYQCWATPNPSCSATFKFCIFVLFIVLETSICISATIVGWWRLQARGCWAVKKNGGCKKMQEMKPVESTVGSFEVCTSWRFNTWIPKLKQSLLSDQPPLLESFHLLAQFDCHFSTPRLNFPFHAVKPPPTLLKSHIF